MKLKKKKEKKIKEPRKKIELTKKKKIALTVLLIIILLAAAVFVGYLKFQEHTKKTIAVQAMKSKYGKVFEVRGIKEIDEENFYAYFDAAGIEGSLVTALVGDMATKLDDDYVSVRLCHRINDEVTEKLQDEYYFIHTDNAIEFTDSGEYPAETISVSDYLKVHPEDKFIVTILVDESLIKPDTLRNTVGAMAYTLTTERGSLDMYSVSHEAFEELKESVSKYDSFKKKEIKDYLNSNSEKILSLSFEEINPPKEEKEEAKDKKDEKSEEDSKDVKDKDNG